MSYSDKLKKKARKAVQNADYMKMARKEKKKDEDMLKLVIAGTASIIIGGLVSIWKIKSDDK